MQAFQFMNPTKILFGQGMVEKLPQEIPVGSKVLILYGGGSIKRSGVLTAVKSALATYDVGEFAGIEPNPTYETLMQAVELIRRERYDFLLAVGGGSVIDGTKFVAAAVPFLTGDPWQLVAERKPLDSALPFGTVLTLPATGSEMNDGAVITRKAYQAKLPLLSPKLFPRFSVLDPAYTYTLPPRQIANGVVDSFIHVIEQYLTVPADGKVQDRFAEGLLLTLLEDGPRALAEPENYAVRANLMWTATLALNGLIGSGVPQDWSTHLIGHELTALYGLDHAQTLAIVLPAALRVRQAEKADKLLQYAERVWGIEAAMPAAEKMEAAIRCTEDFFRRMGLKTSLQECGLAEPAIEAVAANLEQHGFRALGEAGTVTPAVVRAILQRSL